MPPMPRDAVNECFAAFLVLLLSSALSMHCLPASIFIVFFPPGLCLAILKPDLVFFFPFPRARAQKKNKKNFVVVVVGFAANLRNS